MDRLARRLRFAFDDDDRRLQEGWPGRADVFDREILVPFPPESPASGIQERGFHPVVWYRRTFKLPEAERGPRLHLTFGAVDFEAQVWVNGQFAGRHEGGHTPFTLDITAWLSGEAEQIVVVGALDDPLDLTQPRGKQYWELEPAKIWYHRTTGIWQPVWLERVGDVFVETVRWTASPERFAVQMRVRLAGRIARAYRSRIRLSLRGETLADDVYLYGPGVR